MPNCINKITEWINSQFLKINHDKTEIILFHPESLINQVIIGGTTVGSECIRFSNEVKNVGVWLDKNFKMDKHINKIVAHCYKLLRDIGRVRRVLSKDHTEQLVHAVVSMRLDYCNSLFFNVGKAHIYKLQKVQNAAARLVVQIRKRSPISAVLRDLHWLRVEERIMFKIVLLVHKVVMGQCSDNLQITYKTHNLRPKDVLLLETKKVNTKYGKRTFDYVGPKLWNALPVHVRTEQNTELFKRQVKTMLFRDSEEFIRNAFKYD